LRIFPEDGFDAAHVAEAPFVVDERVAGVEFD
jgi:hypothetical protein